MAAGGNSRAAKKLTIASCRESGQVETPCSASALSVALSHVMASRRAKQARQAAAAMRSAMQSSRVTQHHHYPVVLFLL